MEARVIEQKLRADFPDAELALKDLTGAGDHWQVDISSAKFTGLGLIAQHKLVYASLAEFMPEGIHALSLNTKEPST